jgi:hypothetical protein
MSVSGEHPTVVSQHGIGPLFLILFFHRCNILMETFSIPQLLEKKYKWE